MIKISGREAIERLVSDDKKVRDSVFIVTPDGYGRAETMMWYFGRKGSASMGRHVASTTFYAERGDLDAQQEVCEDAYCISEPNVDKED